tara:strand:- start:27 stop:272 length:246 start_codon:yes stop_codon:yes gene_type:complete
MTKLRLVNNISEWKRWWSLRFIIATTVFSSVTAAYIMLPPDWLPEIPVGIKQFLAAGSLITAAAAGIARVTHQKNLGSGEQ